VISSVVRGLGDVRVGCCMRSCASRSLTGVNWTLRGRKEVGDDLLYLGVQLLDNVMLGRYCSMRSWPSSSLAGVEWT
jgi:hypothetical protein